MAGVERKPRFTITAGNPLKELYNPLVGEIKDA
jgi:hypothetical protein